MHSCTADGLEAVQPPTTWKPHLVRLYHWCLLGCMRRISDLVSRDCSLLQDLWGEVRAARSDG